MIENETLVGSCECLKFENDDFTRRGHILNAMPDPLFDVYQNYPTARELWKALEERFFAEGATNLILLMPGDPSVLEGYTYGSKKQSWLTDLTMTVEFVAMALCYKEVEWL
ncbi:hypothetical protein Tco_0356516 [Tanacetum coccineum]